MRRLCVVDMFGLCLFGLMATGHGLAGQPQFVAEPVPGGWCSHIGDNRSVAAGDLDGDGDVDLVWSEWGAQFEGPVVLFNDGLGRFRRDTSRFPGGVFRSGRVLLQDFDRDGDIDVITLGVDLPSFELSAHYWRNDGTGLFQDVSAATLPPNRRYSSSFTKAADFDGDGILDVCFWNSSLWWRGTSTGSFVEVPITLQAHVDELGDLDGRGSFDVLAVSTAGVEIHTNTALWRFSLASIVPTPQALYPFDLELADIDHDGDSDLLVVAIVHSGLWLNDGFGRFTYDPAALVAPVTYSTCAAFADYDEDGDLDLWMGNGIFYPQVDQLYVNDGRGRFVDVTSSRVQQQPRGTVSVVAVDVDLDGDIDVVAQHGDLQPDGALYRNMLRDAAFVSPVRIGNPATIRLAARRGFAAATQFALPALSTLPLSPVAVPPFGLWRLNLTGLVMLPVVVLPSPAGEQTFTVPVPAVQSLVGQTVSVQALIAHDTAASTWRFSNVARATIER